MSHAAPVFSAPFQDLEAYGDWALATESERTAKRVSSPMPAIQAFYDALLPRLEACAAYLDQFPVDDMPPDARRLLWLTLSLMEVANAVELYKQPRLSNGFEIARFVPLEKDT
ncbi:MAG: hypothetical protein J4F42_11490 [Desulfurellaceae bacterium]|nr:hypothetical protein [Desulfurellaceae bacterium]